MMRVSKFFAVAGLLALVGASAGCSERHIALWEQSHEFEGEGFGDASRQTYARQIVDPDAVKHSPTGAAYDGSRAVKDLGSYKNKTGAGSKKSGGKAETFTVTKQ